MLGPADRRPLLFSTPDLPDQPSPSLRGLVGVEPSASSVDLHVVPRKILDTVGHERPRLVSVDEIKVRFFSLGLQTGFGLQMFLMSAVLMAAAQRQGDAQLALSLYSEMVRVRGRVSPHPHLGVAHLALRVSPPGDG